MASAVSNAALKSYQKIVDFREKNASLNVFPRPAVLSSYETSWKGVSLEYHEQPKYDTGELVLQTHQILMCLQNSPIPMERWLNDQFQAEITCTGNVLIAPAKSSLRIRQHHHAKFMIMSFEPGWLKRISQEFTDGESVDLLPVFPPVQDPLVQGLLTGLMQELENHGLGGDIYADQLKTTLALHLLRNYTTRAPKVQDYDGGLSPCQLRRLLDYIQANLDQTIKLEDLAKLLGMSQFYFCRLFRDSMGMPPHQYVIAQRIERAKNLLRQSNQLSIAEIALTSGFSNQSHLCKHFRKLVGTTPNAYRKDLK
ncbi:MAG: helix-turn-helix transcriptional regulator [Leptolyngbya sp. SIO3F4]|nr:helix-turn-helix transcriptional regulator [Leptolyngbya sp. SIO3F4]